MKTQIVMNERGKKFNKTYHPLLEKHVPPFLLDVYKDFTFRGYCIMFLVSFIAVGAMVAAAMWLMKYLQL